MVAAAIDHGLGQQRALLQDVLEPWPLAGLQQNRNQNIGFVLYEHGEPDVVLLLHDILVAIVLVDDTRLASIETTPDDQCGSGFFCQY